MRLREKVLWVVAGSVLGSGLATMLPAATGRAQEPEIRAIGGGNDRFFIVRGNGVSACTNSRTPFGQPSGEWECHPLAIHFY